MENMNRIFVLFIMLGISAGQSYSITIFGIPAADVVQTIHDSGKIEFTTQNRGIFDLFWPAKNSYEAIYDSNSFALKNWSKNVKQGEFKQHISAKVDFLGYLAYDDKSLIEIPHNTYTIFTLLAMVQSRPYDKLDTKWFNYEQEGLIGKARFVWADTSNAWNGKDSILCDHYRLDINITDKSDKFLDRTDYFMEEILADGVVRELWVSRKKPKRIIRASLKTAWFPVSAIFNE